MVELEVVGVKPGEMIPVRFAFGKAGESEPFVLSSNLSPGFRFRNVPKAAQSLALLIRDGDVPSSGELVNQPGVTVPYELARVDFYHLALVDIPASVKEIKEGALSQQVTPHGKPVGSTLYGRQGKNDFTGWFAGDESMAGVYGGYDGPCPPWNDERIHRYVFTLFALSVPRLPLPEGFGGVEANAALLTHGIASASVVAPYAIYADAR